jgi:hypothetical protein
MASIADQIREHARRAYIDPARHRHQATVRIVAGEVHAQLGLRNRARSVCAALRSKKFSRENRLVLEQVDGPPSGESTTVALTFRLTGGPATQPEEQEDVFHRYLGSGEELFHRLGGGENFIRRERAAWKDRLEP